MITIALTGASGAMGKETLKALMASQHNFKVKLLLLKSDKAFGLKVKSQYKSRIEIIYGDVRSYGDCLELVKDSRYVLHLAALIPPKADYNQDTTIAINYNGTKNIVDAIKSLSSPPKLVHVSTVAIYGNRNYKHPWGRVGDPLLPSIFDVYATSKMKAERYVLESGLEHFAVLRQTGILHDNLLINNVKDGLMFHTPWNTPIEWVTAKDSGILMSRIVERDLENSIPFFWKKVYNVGGGKGYRQTGYDTFDDGFKVIGGNVESFFEPYWNSDRNFHCFWFNDSNVLNDMFHFQNGSSDTFWQDFKKSHRLYSVAKILPPAIVRKMVIEPLLNDENAPSKWIRDDNNARVKVAFSVPDLKQKYSDWKSFPLLKNNLCNDGFYDYEKAKNSPSFHLLNHGYDESKPDSELDIEDMQMVAKFRGGQCLSKTMIKGDLYTPLTWRCHKGHIFRSSPYTILKAGHWCEECAPLTTWNYDLIVPYVPFYQQVWYDSFPTKESNVYTLVNNQANLIKGAVYES